MYISFARTISFVFLNLALLAPVCGQYHTLDNPVGEMQKFDADSGIRSNTDEGQATVWNQVVGAKGTAWVRVYFDRNTKLNVGSVVRITSLLDGDVQELDSQMLATWNYSSAYFNGSFVQVELVAGSNTKMNRVVIDQVALQFDSANKEGGCGICGADTRTPSNEDWSGRLLPAGCTASIYNEDNCLVSAGHCIAGNDIVQFRVPFSNGDCTLNHPPAADQFPITNVQFANGGVGNDWAALLSGTNSLGETIFDRYGVFMPLATTSVSVGNPVNVWGYGVDSQCTRSQIQQVDTNPGNITQVFGAFFQYTTDATFGNSGSAVVRNGEIVGIATHCPCPNVGMRIDFGAFVNARQNICVSTGPKNDDCEDAQPISNGTFDFDTSEASTDGPALPAGCDEGFGLSFVDDIWYEYTATCTGQATIDLCNSDYDTRLAVYTGEGGCPGTLIDCNDDYCDVQSRLVIDVVAGEDYIIRIGGFNGGGTGTMVVSCAPDLPPTSDFFWSTADLNGGAENESMAEVTFSEGSSGSLYLYYNTLVSEIDTGAFIDIATSTSGVIEFTAAETLDYDITAGGVPFTVRWGDAAGATGDVSANFIDELGAVNVVMGTGILNQNTGPVFFDEGYDASADAFLFARVDFDVVGPEGSSVEILTVRGVTGIVHNGVLIDPSFGVATINVSNFLLGDVNCDGVVDLLDVQPFIDLLSSGEYSPKADIDGDGAVTLLDVSPFIAILTGG